MQVQDKSLLLAAWLEGNLDTNQQAAFERLRMSDTEFAQRVAACEQMQTLAQGYTEYDVPKWDMESTFSAGLSKQHEARPWWQWQGLPWLSLATSMVAILMVTLNVQVQIKDDVLLIGFANSFSEAQIASLVDERMQDIDKQNTQRLALYQQQLQQQQQQFSTQLADYILTSNRSERKEDFAELIKYVNQQRSDDQIYYASQLSLLEANLNQGTFEE